MKILNLYAGIGGNRKLWPAKHEVTAVEINPAIAQIYNDFFPQDKVIIGDAHQYLLEHFEEYDFIWSSPPCPSHSQTIFFNHIKPRFPDMKLYEEIIFLKHFYKGKWLIENVKSYYDPLILPVESERHYFWSNFTLGKMPVGINQKVRNDKGFTLNEKMRLRGFEIKDFHSYKGDKRTLLNNIVEPELGLYILQSSEKEIIQTDLLGARP
jgi:DNA (cytosine-5)-methyltransferase 1